MMWGQEEHVRQRFAGAGIDDISFERDSFIFRHDGSPAEFVALFREYHGPTLNAFAAARDSGRQGELERELIELFERLNQSDDPRRTEIPATFLRVTATKPA